MTTKTLEYPDYSEDIQAELDDTNAVLELIKSTDVTSPKEGEAMIASIRDRRKELIELNEAALAAFKPVIDHIQSAFDKMIQAVSDMEGIIRSRVLVIRSQIETSVIDATREVEQAYLSQDRERIAKAVQAFNLLAPFADMVDLPEKGRWDFEVVDPELIPARFMTVNQPAIFYEVMLRKDQTDIPGIRVFRKKV